MFEEFFGLAAKPFGKTPDPSFLYESRQHREALARLEYAVEEKELALLVGDIGSGKTTLSRALIDRVADSRPIILLINPRLTPTQLLRAVARGLGIELARFRNDLLDLSVVLIGQPELEARIDRDAYEPLRQRIGMRYSLGPLSADETVEYIEHRIRVAGGARNPFSNQAMEEIHLLSGGIPRLINTLATTALLDAFGEDAETIDPSRIASAAREHHMESAHG
jgi:general secretion pathway protein A